MRKILLLSLFGLLTLSACNLFQPKVTPAPQNLNVAAGTPVSIVLPTQDYLKYCNGADMDSEGFKKTITQKETVTISETNLSQEQLANKMLVLAAQKANITFPQSNENPLNYIKIKNQTAYLEPTDGWAGVSIFLCFWKPFVEVNLLQFPGIKNVIWTTDQAQWQGLK